MIIIMTYASIIWNKYNYFITNKFKQFVKIGKPLKVKAHYVQLY